MHCKDVHTLHSERDREIESELRALIQMWFQYPTYW